MAVALAREKLGPHAQPLRIDYNDPQSMFDDHPVFHVWRQYFHRMLAAGRPLEYAIAHLGFSRTETAERGASGRYLGISRLLNRLGILKLIDPKLASAEEMVDSVPMKFLRSFLNTADKDVEVIQFVACGPNFITPEVGKSTKNLLDKAGAKHG